MCITGSRGNACPLRCQSTAAQFNPLLFQYAHKPTLLVPAAQSESSVRELPTGELIEVVVLSLKGNQIKPSTDAPKHLPVVPEELLEGAAD